MNDPVKQFEVDGLTVKLFQDTDAQSPQDWGDTGLFLVPFCPRRLINLADMIKFLASGFVESLNELGDFKHLSLEAVKKGGYQELSSNAKSIIQNVLDRLSKSLKLLELVTSLDRLAAINRRLIGLGGLAQSQCTSQVIADDIEALQHSIWFEISDISLLFIPTDKRKYFESPHHFGSTVYSFFENARQEIKEAGNCFTAELYTACVLHCVRVVEFGMREMAEKLKAGKASALKYSEWGKVIDKMESKLQKIKGKKRGIEKSGQFDLYGRAISDCKALLETRNRVCHARDPFIESEALTTMKRTKEFMEIVCKILKAGGG